MATTTKKKNTTEDLLTGMLSDYQSRAAYVPKSTEEIQAQAQGEYQPYYDQLRLSARQQQQRADLALQQQRAGLQDTYDRQREASAKDYRQRYSQADRQMLSRGMQRSSYGAQTLANINQQGAEAQQRLWDAQGAAEGNIDAQRAQLESQLGDQLRQYDASMAADVLNRTRQLSDQEYERAQAQQQRNDQMGLQLASALRQAERDKISDEQFERQFGLSKQQAEAQLANMEWQRGMSEREFAAQLENQAWQRQRTENQDRIAQEQWAKQFGLNERQLEADLANQAWQRERQEARDKVSDEQFERQFGLSKAQFDAQVANQQWQQQRTEAQDRLAAEQWAKQFGLNERELAAQLANQAWQRDLNERQFQNTLENQAWQRNYQINRDAVNDAQWQQNYDFNSKKWEDTLAEQLYQRQYQESRDTVKDAQWEKEFGLKERELGLKSSGSSNYYSGGGGYSYNKSSGSNSSNTGTPYNPKPNPTDTSTQSLVDRLNAALSGMKSKTDNDVPVTVRKNQSSNGIPTGKIYGGQTINQIVNPMSSSLSAGTNLKTIALAKPDLKMTIR